MKAIIIGAGIIGTLTAYYLAREGVRVTVIDQHHAIGQGTSGANGAQLSYSFHEPFGSPALFRQLPSLLRHPQRGPTYLSFRTDPALWEWYFRLLLQSLPSNTKRNAANLLTLHLYSRWKFAQFFEENKDMPLPISARGKLHLYTHEKDLARAKKSTKALEEQEMPQEVLDRAGCISKEPTLKPVGYAFIGGMFSPSDMTLDMETFMRNLMQRMDKKFMPVNFQFNTRVTSFTRDTQEVFHLITDKGDMQADIFIIAGGLESHDLLQELGLHLPIQPIKGHSLSAPIVKEHRAPKISITLHDEHVVFAPMNGWLRAAGLTEFGTQNTSIDQKKIDILKGLMERYYPDVTEIGVAQSWAGLRPATPWSTPVISATPYKNLYINAGHGMFGWTQAHGSAKLMTDIIRGRKTEISQELFVL